MTMTKPGSVPLSLQLIPEINLRGTQEERGRYVKV